MLCSYWDHDRTRSWVSELPKSHIFHSIRRANHCKPSNMASEDMQLVYSDNIWVPSVFFTTNSTDLRSISSLRFPPLFDSEPRTTLHKSRESRTNFVVITVTSDPRVAWRALFFIVTSQRATTATRVSAATPRPRQSDRPPFPNHNTIDSHPYP